MTGGPAAGGAATEWHRRGPTGTVMLLKGASSNASMGAPVTDSLAPRGYLAPRGPTGTVMLFKGMQGASVGPAPAPRPAAGASVQRPPAAVALRTGATPVPRPSKTAITTAPVRIIGPELPCIDTEGESVPDDGPALLLTRPIVDSPWVTPAVFTRRPPFERAEAPSSRVNMYRPPMAARARLTKVALVMVAAVAALGLGVAMVQSTRAPASAASMPTTETATANTASIPTAQAAPATAPADGSEPHVGVAERMPEAVPATPSSPPVGHNQAPAGGEHVYAAEDLPVARPASAPASKAMTATPSVTSLRPAAQTTQTAQPTRRPLGPDGF